MGNLPTSRTATLTPADALPSALIDEIQDNIIGRKFGPKASAFIPSVILSGAAPLLVAAPGGIALGVWKLTTANTFTYAIPFDAGDTFVGLSVDIYGDAAVDVLIDASSVGYGATLNATSVIGSNAAMVNVSAAWQSLTYVIAPTVLAAAGWLSGRIQITGGAFLHMGYVRPIFQRL